LIYRTLARVLDDAIARANVVQRKVAEGVNDLFPRAVGTVNAPMSVPEPQ
jgi:hypothetical protein